MRFIKKRILVAVICIAISGALSWKLLNVAESSKETVRVIRATEVIKRGTMITGDKLRTVEIGSYGLSEGTIIEGDKVVGMYASADIYPGDNLTADKFTHIEETADGFLILAQNDGKSAVSVGVKSISSALAGKLRKGDVVSVLVYVNEITQESRRGYVEEYGELRYVEIGAISNNKAEDIVYRQEGGDGSSPAGGAKTTIDGMIPASVTFIVDSVQARRLVEAENMGNIHLVFRGRGEYARQLLAIQEEVLNNSQHSGNPALLGDFAAWFSDLGQEGEMASADGYTAWSGDESAQLQDDLPESWMMEGYDPRLTGEATDGYSSWQYDETTAGQAIYPDVDSAGDAGVNNGGTAAEQAGQQVTGTSEGQGGLPAKKGASDKQETGLSSAAGTGTNGNSGAGETGGTAARAVTPSGERSSSGAAEKKDDGKKDANGASIASAALPEKRQASNSGKVTESDFNLN